MDIRNVSLDYCYLQRRTIVELKRMCIETVSDLLHTPNSELRKLSYSADFDITRFKKNIISGQIEQAYHPCWKEAYCGLELNYPDNMISVLKELDASGKLDSSIKSEGLNSVTDKLMYIIDSKSSFLSKEERRVLYMRFYLLHTYDFIADDGGFSTTKAKSIIDNTLERIYKRLIWLCGKNSIESSTIPPRIKKVLKSNGILTYSQLLDMRMKDLMNIKDLSRRDIIEILSKAILKEEQGKERNTKLSNLFVRDVVKIQEAAWIVDLVKGYTSEVLDAIDAVL